MQEDSVQIRVRYSETDQMGIVYHGSYIPYFEIGRVEWLRNKGLSYKTLEERGVALPIVTMKIDYKKPARYDDLLNVKTRLKKHSSVRIEFDCEITNEENELLTTGHFILVFMNVKTGRAMLPPDYINDILSKL